MVNSPTFVFILLAALWAASFPHRALAQAGGNPAPANQAQIDRNGVIILTRAALMALDQANKTGNYTVVRDLSAPSFAAANNAARLGEIFANLRRDKIDLSGVLVLDPQLTMLPEIDKNGMMHFAGFFPSAPAQINFELIFAPVDGQWKLFGMMTKLGSLNPVAPPPPPAPEKKDEKKKPAKQKE
jgi:hypothetical protein